MSPLLEVKNLVTRFYTEEGAVHAVNGISYTLDKGESMAIVGESGSGKSVGVLSIMGLIPTPPGKIEGGVVLYNGQDLLDLSAREMADVRGKEIAMVFQDPMTSLNPVLTIRIQLTEALERHLSMSTEAASDRAVELLNLVGIPNAKDRINDYPHQFSGGQRQRIGIAMALLCNPGLLIADEPTTALDVTIQAQIMELVGDLQRQLGMAIIWITHDLGVVAGLVEKVAVMYGGFIVEMGSVKDVYKRTSHPYTLGLLESIPVIEGSDQQLIPIPGLPADLLKEPHHCPFAPRCRFVIDRCWEENPPLQIVTPTHQSACWRWQDIQALHSPDAAAALEVTTKTQQLAEDMAAAPPDILLEVRNLKKHFPILEGLLRRQTGAVRAVDGVSFEVRRGETLGLVGESGCGKSTTGQTILQLLKPTAGEVILDGQDLTKLDKEALRQARRHMQMIFQDPYASLNPRITVGEIVGEALDIHNIGSKASRQNRVIELLQLVGLNPYFVNRYPHEFSGGQRQRIGIARALATNPAFIVADEPISALDVSIQAQVINLMQELKEKLGLTYLFIAHDLSMVRYISDRVAVMYLGQMVELSDRNRLFDHPLHPYTQALLSAIPVPDPDREATRTRIVLKGDVPNPANPPSGCRFHTRCGFATEICQRKEPEFRNLGTAAVPHHVACHHADQFL
ncbi:MAG: ABC transporter ATP-binding protein [Ardenticatenaceae bacterium]|nr:ABC transporter ATP-binding protein [Ardenticatenaceae bacterium]